MGFFVKTAFVFGVLSHQVGYNSTVSLKKESKGNNILILAPGLFQRENRWRSYGQDIWRG